MSNSRIQVLDSIRGLAIIGIILVNVISFSWPELYDSYPSSYWNTPIENLIHWILLLFVQSSFYPVFAMLFGVSMFFVFNSAKKKGMNPYTVFLKRLIILLIIGLTHAIFIWHGDILVVYALLGLLLLPFYQLRAKSLLTIGFTLWMVPNALYALFLFVSNSKFVPYENGTNIQEVITQYQSGFPDVFIQNFQDWLQLYSFFSFPFLFFSIFPMFLFGLSLAKSNLLSLIAVKQLNVNTIWCCSGLVGLFLKALPLMDNHNMLFTHLAEAFGGPILGLFYALSIMIFANKHTRLQAALSYVGRMSLSNYLFQSLTGFLIFKVFGFYGKASPLLTLAIAICILSIQLFLSKWWFIQNKIGPLEDIWRRLTYFQPWKSEYRESCRR